MSRQNHSFEVEGLEDRRLLTIYAPPLHLGPAVHETFHSTYRIAVSAGPGQRTYAATAPVGLDPTALRHAYTMDNVKFGSLVGDGTGQTIAIVDAYDAPTVGADLATFDSTFGLADPPSFVRLNQNGAVISNAGVNAPSTDIGNRGNSWAIETALDVEWAHAVAPGANIVLVEANSASDSDLFKAVDTARKYTGVSAVSMSWGGGEFYGESYYDQYMTTPASHNGVTFLASSGDNGAGSSFPSVSSKVVSVGGTRLTLGSGSAWVGESGWSGSGGALSTYYAQPSYQSGLVTQSTTVRAMPDVALDADPASGVAVIDSWDLSSSAPWLQVGGTSLACPLWAGVIAIANQGRANNGLGTLDGPTETLPKLYQLSSSDFHDITTGSNGAYSAGVGYDLVTGRGTPIVNLVALDLAGTPVTPTPTIGALSVNPTSVSVGTTVTLTASNVVENNGSISTVTFYRESNGNAGFQAGDTVVGTGTRSGSTWTLGGVSTTGLSPGSYTFYAVATDASSVQSTAASASLYVTGPTPVIGSFTVSPTSVTAGGNLTFTTGNVSESGGSVSSVRFYRESNSISGLQTGAGGDTLVGAGTQSSSTWTLSNVSTAGLTPGSYSYYAVAIDAANVNSTAWQSAVRIAAPTLANDNFAAASIITGTSATVTGTNFNATKQIGEPNITANTGGKSVWWNWTAPTSGTVTIDTRGSNFDTLLGVFTGKSVGALSRVASNDDIDGSTLASAVTFTPAAGTTYHIVIDGFNAAAGDIVLNLSHAAATSAPKGDSFAGASALTGSTATFTGSNVGATKEAGEPNHAGNYGGASLWFTWTAPSTRTVALDTKGSSFDTLLAVYTGATLGGLSTVASNDDDPAGGGALTSALTFNAVAGTTYRIAVDGYDGAVGNVTLNLT